MVFDPTFHEITDDADALPDLDGSGAQDDALDGDGDVEADDLEPIGE